MVDNFLVSTLMTLGRQQAAVAALVDPEWRWKWEQMENHQTVHAHHVH